LAYILPKVGVVQSTPASVGMWWPLENGLEKIYYISNYSAATLF